jgi:hypothetical protein
MKNSKDHMIISSKNNINNPHPNLNQMGNQLNITLLSIAISDMEISQGKRISFKKT